jgi:hypothetical protein
MISAQEKESYVKHLTKHYSVAIIAELNKKEIKPPIASAWSKDLIQRIMNGQIENLEVEIAIIELVEKTEAAKIKLAKRKKKFSNGN